MAETAYYKFPLYDPEDAPDLTATGEESQAIEAIDTALHAEHLERVAADEAEAEARESADTELSKEIAREASERKEADEAEARAREAADTALGARIDAEADTRATEYELLKGKLETEAETRETADTELGGKITQEGLARKTADDAEAAERKAADTALGARIDAEAETRQEQDAVLGTEVTGLNNSVNGIMGLNYGADNDPLVKVEEGAYSSPALEKIAQQFEESGGSGFYVIDFDQNNHHILTADDVTALTNTPEMVVLVAHKSNQNGAAFYAGTAYGTITYRTCEYSLSGRDYTDNGYVINFNSLVVRKLVSGIVVGAELSFSTLNHSLTQYPASTTSYGPIRIGTGISVTNGITSTYEVVADTLIFDEATSISATASSLSSPRFYLATCAYLDDDYTRYVTCFGGITQIDSTTFRITLSGTTYFGTDPFIVLVSILIDTSGSATEASFDTIIVKNFSSGVGQSVKGISITSLSGYAE